MQLRELEEICYKAMDILDKPNSSREEKEEAIVLAFKHDFYVFVNNGNGVFTSLIPKSEENGVVSIIDMGINLIIRDMNKILTKHCELF